MFCYAPGAPQVNSGRLSSLNYGRGPVGSLRECSHIIEPIRTLLSVTALHFDGNGNHATNTDATGF